MVDKTEKADGVEGGVESSKRLNREEGIDEELMPGMFRFRLQYNMSCKTTLAGLQQLPIIALDANLKVITVVRYLPGLLYALGFLYKNMHFIAIRDILKVLQNKYMEDLEIQAIITQIHNNGIGLLEGLLQLEGLFRKAVAKEHVNK
jgi:hypothetical protein